MRILHVAKFPPGTPGGIERFVGELARAQARAGDAVAVFACTGDGDSPPASDDGVALYLTRSLGQWLYLPLAPGFPFALRRAIRHFRPDVLHVQWPNPLALALLLVPEARRVPWLLHWQADIAVAGGPPSVAAVYRPFAGLERALLRRARRVVTSSAAYRDASLPLAAFRDRVVVVPNGLAMGAPTASPHDGWDPAAALRVLCIARLVPYKGVDRLISAVRRTPGVQAVIVGEGPLGAALRAAGEDLAAAGRLRFAGALPDHELERWLAGCDLLALPSVNRLEAFGMTLLEAARAGKPALATHVPGSGMAEVIGALGAGWLVRPDDVDALADCLAETALRRREGPLSGPRAEALRTFDIANVASTFAALYADAVRSV